ncbi:MAG: SDR family NAD(P)-dependent oxidoreductase [Wenzhouxiangella sp.]|nr:MAG: SDR family NAD(P)-dependent oxidoreductase [Wenzhouxiangella sp.]
MKLFCRRLFPTTCLLLLALFVAGLVLPAAAAAESVATESPPVALVTGSTRGLGEEVARRLGEMGYHVIVHGRSVERGEAVVADIIEAGGRAEFRRADFLSLDEVRALADGVLADFDRLDLLVNNAGIGSDEDGQLVSVEGYEAVFQVNYLAHFLLTEKLLPLLIDSAPARIVNVSSGAQAPIDFDDVMLEDYEPDGREIGRPYAQSKLAQILHTYDMAERLDGTGVIINALHPATFMDTYMVRRAGIEPRTDVDEGADRVMQLITDEVGSGHYFRDGEPARAHDQAYDADARERLRQISLELVGLED